MKKYIIILLIVVSGTMNGQTSRQSTDNLNGWFMYFGDHKFADKWGLHAEVQLRRNNVITDNQQLLLRTGINYHLNSNVFFTAGYCFVETHPYGEFPTGTIHPEHRIWEQAQLKTHLSSVEWVTRFRLEQRWIQSPTLSAGVFERGDAVYKNRFRVLNRFSIPFKGKRIEDKSLYVSAYNELFINFGENTGPNLFDQNRTYLALGYKVPKLGRLEFGYLNQIVVKADGLKVEYNHTLQLGLFSNLRFGKGGK